MKKKKEGFTLIELLTVLVIIGIVLMIAIPSVSKLMYNQNEKKLKALIDAALKASNVYIDEYKSGFIESHDKYNFTYETLLGKNYVKEEDIKCSGTIQATRKKGNNYTYKAYLMCKDKNGNVVSDNTNELPEGGISIQGKFIMDYEIRYNDKNGNKYDNNYTRNNLYNEFIAYDLERVGPTAGISKYKYSYDNKNWIELSANEVTGMGSFVISSNYVGKVYFKAYDMYGNESETISYNIKIDKISPTGTITIERNGGSYNSLSVKANLNAKDNPNGSGVKQMCVQESSNVNLCSWVGYQTSKSLTLSGSLDGRPRRVYAWFKDGVGNIEQAKSGSGDGTTGADYTPYKEGTEIEMTGWSICSKVCGGGTQRNIATDKYTKKEIPEKSEIRECNTMDCCSKTIRTGNSNWSTCSKTCGGGTQTRDVYYKSYYNGQTCPTAVKGESQSCNTQSCDVTPPTFSIVKATSWVTSDNIKVTIKDQESGVVAYQWTTTTTKPTSWTNITKSQSTTITRNFTSNQTMYIWAKDAVGNVGYTTVIENKIDNTKPTQVFSLGSSTSGSNGWYKDLTVKVTTSDVGSGVKSAKYCTTTSSTCTPGTIASLSGGVFNISLGTNSSAQKVCVNVTDNVNQTSTVSCSSAYYVDKTDPIAKISATVSGKTVTISSSTSSDSGSGINKREYKLDSGVWYTGSDVYSFSNVASGNHTIYIRVTDKSGRTATASATIKIDSSYVLLDKGNSKVSWSSADNMQCACKAGGLTVSGGNKGSLYKYCSSSNNYITKLKSTGLYIEADNGGEYSDGEVYTVGGVSYSSTTIDFSKYTKLKVKCDGYYWYGQSTGNKNYAEKTITMGITNDPLQKCPTRQTEEEKAQFFKKTYTLSCGSGGIDNTIDISDISGSYHLTFYGTGDMKCCSKNADIFSIVLEN